MHLRASHRSTRPLLRAALTLLALAASACSAPRLDLAAWRAEVPARPVAERGEPAADLVRVDALRAARDLAAARTLALQLAAERPEDPAVRLAASRAESDGLWLFADEERTRRDHAAESAREHACAAVDAGLGSPAALAQLAWSLGATTHLQPMFDRGDHAGRTVAAAEQALVLEPGNATAEATLAVVNLRLETLPWIAKVFARSRPDSSMDAAERHARAAVAGEPSREHVLILAKVLAAGDREAEAAEALEAALAAPPRFARDEVVAPAARAFLDGLR